MTKDEQKQLLSEALVEFAAGVRAMVTAEQFQRIMDGVIKIAKVGMEDSDLPIDIRQGFLDLDVAARMISIKIKMREITEKL